MIKKSAIAAVLALAGLVSMPVHADSECVIEHSRFRTPSDYLVVEGVSNCREGKLYLRAFMEVDGKKEFIGIAETYIKGYQFEVWIDDVPPSLPGTLQFGYSIE